MIKKEIVGCPLFTPARVRVAWNRPAADVPPVRPARHWAEPSVKKETGDAWRLLITLALFAVAGIKLVYAQQPDDETQAESEVLELEPIVVEGRAQSLVGIATSASQGATGRAQLEARPILRPGEVLETVPGLVATQHSGSGKANQFFLRGFNLDHGTDFATSVEGVPINLRTHAHGQGYLDINFLIPELIKTIEYRKGPYYADSGDFASAGSADIELVDRLPRAITKLEVGQYHFYRAVLANSFELGGGDLLYGLQARYYDGPWVNPEHGNKFTGRLKYTGGDEGNGYSLSALAYYNEWTATDQIARRAVERGLIDRFGTLDPTDGGETERYGLSGDWWVTGADGSYTQASVYAQYYRVNLFSNFTFFLEDPVRGDQIEQAGRRAYAGGDFSHLWFANWFGKPIANTVGVQVRHDQIFEVALFETDDRERLNTVRDDEVAETSVGVFFENEIQWARKLRTVLGLRGDLYYFDAGSAVIEANSGTETDAIVSPKLSVILGPWDNTEYYLNLGTGFHSNDARGVTTQVNPQTGELTAPADPLVRSAGAELGVRTAAVPGLVSSLALWYLHLDSELVFVGDAGSTEAGPASERYGVEWNNFYRPRTLDWLTLNLDVALTEAQFAEGGGEIINSVGRVISAGATVDLPGAWFGSVRVRHFGDRPLTGDGRIKAEATTLTNLRLGYERETFELGLEVFNVFDAKDPDISYFYATRLRGEPPGGVEGELFHPVIPRTIRGYATIHF